MLSTVRREARIILVISLLLMTGFLSTSLISYFVANDSLDAYIRTNSLPLTSDNIYSEIQRDILPTIVISSLMAQDTFVRDWMIAGEEGPDKMTRYLNSIQQQYDTATAFFVSEQSRVYYHSSGVLKTVTKNDPQDRWYFRVSQLNEAFEINVDTDSAVKNQTNIFVNHKVTGYNGDYLGAIGVGLSSETVINLVEFYQKQYARQVYFTEPDGRIALSGKNYQGAPTVYQTPGLRAIASTVLGNTSGSYVYSRLGQTVFLETRFLPELNWYLFVEQTGNTEPVIKQALWLNLVLSVLVTAIVLYLTYFIIRQYQHRTEWMEMATTDKLTGINNRRGFDPIFSKAMQESVRKKEPLSIVLVDLDHFKSINDNHGHITGDQALIQIARILKSSIKNSDYLCRWGGEEFMLLLPEHSVALASQLSETIRQRIENESILINDHSMSITASFGVTQYLFGESRDVLFTRVDRALYTAKKSGRNRVEQT